MPWKILADAAGEYTEWQVFALWLRAVLDACEGMPDEIALEIERRSPALASRIASVSGNSGHSSGSTAWEETTHWAESNVFAKAKRERWLNAIRYFSSKSLLSMKAWSYWEDIHRQWSDEKPATLPSYKRWFGATSAVSRLSNPKSDAEKVLDSVRLIPEERWQQMFGAFLELTTLCLWIEILLETGQTGTELVRRELTARHPHFDASNIHNSPAALSAFADWIIGHEPPFASVQPPLLALSYHTKSHPAYYARLNYAGHCRGLWNLGNPDRLPSFGEWSDAADGYFER